jgi:hypothetical protein
MDSKVKIRMNKRVVSWTAVVGDGLHQAVEAKKKELKLKTSTQTYATLLQNSTVPKLAYDWYRRNQLGGILKIYVLDTLDSH